MGTSFPVSQNPMYWTLLFTWKHKWRRTEVVCKGGSEEKRTRAVPVSERHRGEGVSNANLKMKIKEREESLGLENARRRELCPTGPDERLDVITTKKERVGE